MTQCQGRTRKGEQCKRDAQGGSPYCNIHLDQEIRPPRTQAPRAEEMPEWDWDAIRAVALGLALVGAIIFFRIRR